MERIIKELKTIFWTSLYFLSWFGSLMLINVLLLREFEIEIVGLAVVVVGALIVAKVVLVLEYVPIPFVDNKKAWIEMFARTLLYIAGVFVVMALEKSFEARHEYGDMFTALKNLARHTDIYHLWVNIICVFGALLFFNIWTVIKKHYGAGVLKKLMFSPLPENSSNQ